MSEQLSIEAQDEEKKHKGVNVVINDKHYHFEDDDATGQQIKEKAGIPVDYSLYRRHHGGNEPISNEETVELHNGDHFFSRPPSNVS
jgi:hypothetical protein